MTAPAPPDVTPAPAPMASPPHTRPPAGPQGVGAAARAEQAGERGPVLVLGIETSCDETAAAVVRGGTEGLSSVVSSQIDLHARFGGVVPEIAGRAHLELLVPVVDEALAANGLTRHDIDWLVPHQANLRIIEGMGRRLGLPSDRVVITVDRHANTSAASVPLALAEACRDGRIRKGDLVPAENPQWPMPGERRTASR